MHLTTEQAGRVSIVRIGETRLIEQCRVADSLTGELRPSVPRVNAPNLSHPRT